MIRQGTNFIPLVAKGNNEAIVAFCNNKIVYSKYVIFGTTYNTQDFTFDYSIRQNGIDVPHTWKCEVLSKAGTDPDNGDYYYCGLLNDKQDVTHTQNPQNIIGQFTTQYTITKVRDVLWEIPFSYFANNIIVMAVIGRGNQYLKSYDFTYLEQWSTTNISNIFQSCPNLTTLTNIGPRLETAVAGATTNFMCNSAFSGGGSLITLDLRGFTQWYKTTNGQGSFVTGCSNLENIYLSESSQYCNQYVNASFNSLSKITSFDFAKLKWCKLSSLSFAGNTHLETITWPSTTISIKTNANLSYMFNNCYVLRTNPHIEQWVGEDGISKPTIVCSNNVFVQQCGKDISVNDRTWYFDFSNWSFSPQYAQTQELGGNGVFPHIYNTNGYAVKADNIHLIPTSGKNYFILYLRDAFAYNTPSTLLTNTIDFDSMVDSQYDIIIGNSGLYRMCYACTAITTIRFGRAEAYTDGNHPSYVINDVFTNSTVSDMDLLAKHINYYRQEIKEDNLETLMNPCNISTATYWTNSIQINDFVDSLMTTQSKQYQMNNLKLIIQFNATQRDIIQTRPNWSTDITTIENNGWEIVFPVNINGIWTDINMSEI